MNSGPLYEDNNPPNVANIKTSPSSTPVTTSNSSTASTSPSSVTSNSGPLHIPAKRLVGYGSSECESGVIRHHHGSHGWNYSPAEHPHPAGAGAFDQYNNTPTYYNLAADPSSRDSRKAAALTFWSPAASTPDYKYGPTTTPGTSAAEQAFPQTWCNYSPYSTSARHHPHSDHPQSMSYLTPPDERNRVSSMVESGFHDSYLSRSYAPPDSVPTTPYPPPGTSSYNQSYSYMHVTNSILSVTNHERSVTVI